MTKILTSQTLNPVFSDPAEASLEVEIGNGNNSLVHSDTNRIFRTRRWVPWLMISVDVLVIACITGLVVLMRYWFLPWFSSETWLSHIIEMLLLVMAIPLSFALRGLYPGYGLGEVERFKRRVVDSIAILIVLVAWITFSVGWGRELGMMLLALIGIVVVLPVADILVRKMLLSFGVWGTPAVVIGSAAHCEPVIRMLKRNPDLGLIPVAVLVDHQEDAKGQLCGVPLAGSLSNLRQWSHIARVALLTIPQDGGLRLTKVIARLPFSRVIVVPNSTASPWLTPRVFSGMLGFEIKKNLMDRSNWLIKRSMDYLLAIPLALVTLPLIGVFMLIIKSVSSGPTVFRQHRIGLGGRVIDMYKLRTMYLDAEQRLEEHLESDPYAREEWNHSCKLRNDPRILPIIGSFLRRTSLDELPQLWNVLRGEMSLVGPRPLPEYHLDLLPRDFRSMRRRVMPGVTGLWQASGRSQGGMDRQQELDTYYIHNWSIWLDVCILVKTVYAVLRKHGAY